MSMCLIVMKMVIIILLTMAGTIIAICFYVFGLFVISLGNWIRWFEHHLLWNYPV